MVTGELLDFEKIPFDDVLRLYFDEVKKLYKRGHRITPLIGHFMSLKTFLDCGIIDKVSFR